MAPSSGAEQGRQTQDEEEGEPSSSAPIESPNVPGAHSILRHADGSGRESEDVPDGALWLPA